MKKSSIKSPFLVVISIMCFIKCSGFGVENKLVTGGSGNNFFNSYFAFLVCAVLFRLLHIVDARIPSLSFIYVLLITLVSSSENRNSPVLIFSSIVSLDQRHPFAGCFITFPLGVVMSN